MSLRITIKYLRDKAGMTQEDLARAADLKLRHIQILESGKGNPLLSTVVKVAKGFGLSIIDFLEVLNKSNES